MLYSIPQDSVCGRKFGNLASSLKLAKFNSSPHFLSYVHCPVTIVPEKDLT